MYLTTSFGILRVCRMITSSIEPKSTDGLTRDGLEEVLPLLRLRDHADRNAFGIDAVDAGGHDDVARLHVGERRDVVQLRVRGAVAAQHALAARALDQHADRGVAVGDELHLGHVFRGQHRRMKAKIKSWVNGYLPPNWQMTPMRAEYSNILLIAATNRGDSLDAALLRPGRFDRRLYFDIPTKHERRDLIDFFLTRKAHEAELDTEDQRDRVASETFGYTPVMIEHLFDEALLVALRDGRREMRLRDVMDAKFDEEVGLKQTTAYTDFDREAVATHEAGHATVAYFLGKGRRLEVLSIIKRRGSLGLLAHSDEEERLTRTRSEIESGIAISLGGLAAEELCLGESGTGPGADLAHATGSQRRWSARSGWPVR